MTTAPTRKQFLLGGGHLAALWALAVLQPMLDLLGQNPSFFIARDNSPGDIVLGALGLALLPPMLMLAFELLASRISPRAYNWLHLAFLASISGTFFVGLISKVIVGPTIAILLAGLALGSALAWLVHSTRSGRNLLNVLIVAPIVVLAVFFFLSPTSEVVFPGSSDAKLRAESGDDVPVVLIVLDELGTGHLMTDSESVDARRFPNFARLASESTWFKNHSTRDFFTPRALPGILTGKLPPDNALPTDRDQPDSIFTLLGKNRTAHVLEPITSLCPDSLCGEDTPRRGQASRLGSLVNDLKYVAGRLVLPPGLAARLPAVDNSFEDLRSEKSRTDRFFVKGVELGTHASEYRRFIRSIPDDRRGLTVMHVLLPHQPWFRAVDGREFQRSPVGQLFDPTDDTWQVGSNGIASAQARMYTQLGLTDRLIGDLRRTLVGNGLWDDAIVVVTADHGTSFKGDGVARRRVDVRAMGEVANPPLFIKFPGQKNGRVEEEHSTTLDILPTIAAAVGIKDPYEFDGVPLQGPIPPRPIEVKDVKNDDRVVSVELSEMVSQREEAIRLANLRLGKGPLYRLGPAPELTGRRVKSVPAGTDLARLDDPRQWDELRLDQPTIPIRFTGETDQSIPPGTIVAVAINGRIQSTTRTFSLYDQVRFDAIVDPASFRPGSNKVGIYRFGKDRFVPLGGNSGQLGPAGEPQ